MSKSKTKLMLGDNIQSLKKLPDNSVDSVVTDPPYGLSFMGKKWDYEVPSVEFWKEVWRVLKPGGHVLSFGGTRTYHRMVVNIEDAGFEIRDQVMWLYGSGFPKSHNIGKAVDKLQGNDREVVGKNKRGMSVTSMKPDKGWNANSMGPEITLTKGTSEYEGWGTALKPSNEPICVARKPLSEKTVALNVLKWGTGGINIDGCRVGSDLISHGTSKMDIRGKLGDFHTRPRIKVEEHITEGRFPANIIFDEIAGAMLDEQSGVSKSTGAIRKKDTETEPSSFDLNKKIGNNSNAYAGQVGGASRFFYNAKVSKKERNMGLDEHEDKSPDYLPRYSKNENGDLTRADGSIVKPVINKNVHPTIKPVALMTYLCRLVTPQGGIVLDPFMGSGSTGIAARLEGFRFVGMEQDKSYFDISEARINNYESYREFIKK